MTANEISKNVFDMIGKQWMLVGAAKDGKVNAMTASWGGLGVMWGKNVAFVFIRQTRYTKEFVDNGDTFSLSFFGDDQRKMLNYMGTGMRIRCQNVDCMYYHWKKMHRYLKKLSLPWSAARCLRRKWQRKVSLIKKHWQNGMGMKTIIPCMWLRLWT